MHLKALCCIWKLLYSVFNLRYTMNACTVLHVGFVFSEAVCL